MKKFIWLLATAFLVSFAIGITDANAETFDNGFVIVRCTVTMSVNVLDNDVVDFGALAQGDVGISSNIVVRNDSNGAITNWDLKVSTQEVSTTPDSYVFGPAPYNRPTWQLGTTVNQTGINTCTLSCVFVSDVPLDSDFADNDVIKLTDQRYQRTNYVFGPETNSYQDALDGDPGMIPGDDMYIPPYATGAGSKADTRNLYFRIKMPTAVTDQYQRRFTIQVTASMSSES